jgi:hypothetical protein
MIIEDQVMLPVKPADSSDVVTIIYINIINSAVNLMVKQVMDAFYFLRPSPVVESCRAACLQNTILY